MLLPSTGIDVVEIGRIMVALERHGERFLRRVFTPAERAICQARPGELAIRFAAKEATMKALGTGARGVGWRDIEVLPNRRGKPLIYLYGRGEERARAIGLRSIDVTLTHDAGLALAVVVVLREGGDAPDMLEDPAESRRALLARLRSRGLLNEGAEGAAE